MMVSYKFSTKLNAECCKSQRLPMFLKFRDARYGGTWKGRSGNRTELSGSFLLCQFYQSFTGQLVT